MGDEPPAEAPVNQEDPPKSQKESSTRYFKMQKDSRKKKVCRVENTDRKEI